jgi:Ca2+-binding RTX toxin-like protein
MAAPADVIRAQLDRDLASQTNIPSDETSTLNNQQEVLSNNPAESEPTASAGTEATPVPDGMVMGPDGQLVSIADLSALAAQQGIQLPEGIAVDENGVPIVQNGQFVGVDGQPISVEQFQALAPDVFEQAVQLIGQLNPQGQGPSPVQNGQPFDGVDADGVPLGPVDPTFAGPQGTALGLDGFPLPINGPPLGPDGLPLPVALGPDGLPLPVGVGPEGQPMPEMLGHDGLPVTANLLPGGVQPGPVTSPFEAPTPFSPAPQEFGFAPPTGANNFQDFGGFVPDGWFGDFAPDFDNFVPAPVPIDFSFAPDFVGSPFTSTFGDPSLEPSNGLPINNLSAPNKGPGVAGPDALVQDFSGNLPASIKQGSSLFGALSDFTFAEFEELAGLTSEQAQQIITEKLEERGIDPNPFLQEGEVPFVSGFDGFNQVISGLGINGFTVDSFVSNEAQQGNFVPYSNGLTVDSFASSGVLQDNFVSYSTNLMPVQGDSSFEYMTGSTFVTFSSFQESFSSFVPVQSQPVFVKQEIEEQDSDDAVQQTSQQAVVRVATPDRSVELPGVNYLDGLLWGSAWDVSGGLSLTYAFLDASIILESDEFGLVSTLPWSSTEKAAASMALSTWGDVSNLQFSLSSNYDQANIKFIKYDGQENMGLLGLTGVPNAADAASYGFDPGWLAFNAYGYGWGNTGLQTGGYGFSTLVHEIGHVLGLAHPHDDGGISSDFTSLGIPSLDTGLNTIMSYNDGISDERWWNPYDSVSADSSWGGYGQIASPMAFDVRAIQYLYGANDNYLPTGTTYLLSDVSSEAGYFKTIWDAGGIDSISAADLTGGSVINLNYQEYIATSSDFSHATGGGLYGGYAIAYGTVIENAIGGSGDDYIYANSASNVIAGNAGDDTIVMALGSTLGGSDELSGGEGFDTLRIQDLSGVNATLTIDWDGSGNNLLVVRSGYEFVSTDTYLSGSQIASVDFSGIEKIRAESGSVYVTATLSDLSSDYDGVVGTSASDTINLSGYSSAAALYVYGLAGDDVLVGPSQGFYVYGGLGADTITGGSGVDTIDAGDGNDLIYASDRDVVLGGLGTDTVRYSSDVSSAYLSNADLVSVENIQLVKASAGTYDFSNQTEALSITGGSAADTITGGLGADIIDGGPGDDLIYASDRDAVTGGSGADTVRYSSDITSAYLSDADLVSVESILITKGSAGSYDFSNQTEALSVTGGSAADTITGGSGADIIDARAGDDTISADQSDLIIGGSGTDTVRFASAVTADYFADTDLVSVENILITNYSAGAYDFSNQTEALSITGGSAADTITGGSGVDTISGSGGGDRINGYAGDDTIDVGSDYYADWVVIGENSGSDYLINFDRYSEDKIVLTANLNGSSVDTYADLKLASTNDDDGFAVLNFGGGNSLTVHGSSLAGLGAEDFYFVTSYTNTVSGTSDADSAAALAGTSGNDFIDAGGGADVIATDAGDDTIDVGSDYYADWVVIGENNGSDYLINFDRYSEDKIYVQKNANGSSVDSFSDLIAISQNNDDGFAVLNFGDDNSLTIHDVSLASLGAEDFYFYDVV